VPRFGWTRLAYLLLVLAILAVLARPDTQGAETRPLAADVPKEAAPAGEGPSNAAKPPETPDKSRRIEREISSLVDLGEDEGPPETQEPLAPARTSAPEAAPSEVHDRGTGPPVFFRLPAGAAPPGVRRRMGQARSAATSAGSRGAAGSCSRWRSGTSTPTRTPGWAPRVQGGHEGTDLMAPAGVPEYAVTDGTVVPVTGANENGWNSLGGYAVMVRADYSVGAVKAGDLFYYAQLGRPSPLKMGARVTAGQVVGYAGDTGQGPEVTRGLFPAHLHLGWYNAAGPRSEVGSGAMNPTRYSSGSRPTAAPSRAARTPATASPRAPDPHPLHRPGRLARARISRLKARLRHRNQRPEAQPCSPQRRPGPHPAPHYGKGRAREAAGSCAAKPLPA
jgi:peptidoglycan LD-endopeptidase LytH